MTNPYEKNPIDVSKVKTLLENAAAANPDAKNWTRSYADQMIVTLNGEMGLTLGADDLEKLLKETKEAHTAYEKELGQADKDWAGWYAKFIADNLE